MRKISSAIVLTVLCIGLSFAQLQGQLLWSSSTDWFVNDIAPTGDADGDGKPDVFVASGDNRAYCYSGGGANKGSIVWSWNVGAPVWTVASISDVNGDGVEDCLAGSAFNEVYCFSGQPTDSLTEMLWSKQFTGDVWDIAVIGDVDGDGHDDCLVGLGCDTVCCLDGHWGKMIWAYHTISDILTVSSIPDVDGDGKEDCLAGGHGNRVLCISGGSSGTGDLIWYSNIGTSVLCVASIDDVTGDGKADCLAGGMDEFVYCFSGGSSGEVDPDSAYWSFPTGAWVQTVAAIEDVDDDGVADCLAGGNSNLVYCISGKDGTEIWSYDTGATVLSVASIADVDGGGKEDCIAGGEANKVFCLEGEHSGGPVIPYWFKNVGGTVKCVAAISDMSGNYIHDVLAGSDDSYVYAYEGGDFGVVAKLKAWLEGPYQISGGGSMATDLEDKGYIPLTSPYSDYRTIKTIPMNVTDWVSVELRTSPTGSTVSQRSFFLRYNGAVVDTNGVTVNLPMPAVQEGDYYIVVRHRNHLAIMSATTHTLQTFIVQLYDFTTGTDKVYGNDAAFLDTGVYGMYSGDADANGQVQNSDKNDYWATQVGSSGYKGADFNMNGEVQNNDKNDYWVQNVGKGTQVE